jgi:DNA-binding response OmpR family regulator
VSVAYVAEEITVIVLGRTSAITTGFASAIEAAGWRWEEIPDLPALLARPLPTRAVIIVPIPTFTTTAYAMIRHLTSDRALPVVAFSAEYRPEVVNSILRAGADDFLPLPVTVEEMVARLGAVMRVHFGAHDELHRSDYRLDEAAHLVTIGGGPPVRLSVGEYRLFRMLFAARNRPVARERLATIPLPHTDLDGQNALDATVSRLRRKVGTDRVITIRGIGYQLVDGQQLLPNVSYMYDSLIAR